MGTRVTTAFNYDTGNSHSRISPKGMYTGVTGFNII